jgi:hypothetical protein
MTYLEGRPERGVLRAKRMLRGVQTPGIRPQAVRAFALTAVTMASIGTLGRPVTVQAYATIEGPPTFSSAPGVPEGRVYEQVFRADKNGNEAGGEVKAAQSRRKNSKMRTTDAGQVENCR